MEDVPSRRSSNDEYEAFVGMEQVHDVMSLELSHQQPGESYLDPSSFGDGASFDEFAGPVDNRYDISHGYEQPAPPQRSHYQSLPPPGSRYDIHISHPPVRAGVPTYPVKTIDPSTCPQYATVRLAPIKPPRIRHSANRPPKKIPMDPKTVEDEVARNVSQILSATKQQKLAQEAQQRCGITPTVTRINYTCSDCGKFMTSQRNLQRHRQTMCRKVGEWVDQSWGEQWGERDRLSEDSNSLPGIGLPHSSFSSESSGWCSPNAAYSPPSTVETIDMGTAMLPLSLEMDDTQTHSSSASHCSNSSGGKDSFLCDSCKKTVCSLRSLKRHQGTCKQYLAEFGAPPQEGQEADGHPRRNAPPRRVVSSACYKEDSSEGSRSPEQGEDPTYRPPSSRRSVPSKKAPADSTQNDEDRSPKQLAAVNTCTDCNRQLCSASNLKRHRATCKAAITKGESGSSTPVPPPAYSAPLPELPARDRNIIDRSYAAAVAASEEIRMQARAAQQGISPSTPLNVSTLDCSRQQQPYTAYIVTSPRAGQQKPWVTVGEHLRAQQMTKMQLEEKDHPQGAILIQNTPAPGAPAHNQIIEIRRPSLIDKEDRPYMGRAPEPTVYKVIPGPLAISHSLSKETRPTHVTVVKSDPSEIPPLESIITTQPLSGDRVTGVPVLVHDSRQATVSKKESEKPGEFQCPECRKTYSCRKNVKRHRMAVHKLTSDDINQFPGPIACPHAVLGDSGQLSPSLPKMLCAIRGESKSSEFQTEPLSPNFHDKVFPEFQDNAWRNSLEYMEDDDQNGPRIALELKPAVEISSYEEKKPGPELAEADSTFNEEKEFGRTSHHSSPGAVSSSGPLPSLASWVGSKRTLTVDIPYLGTRSAGHSPLFKSRRLDHDPSYFFYHDEKTPLDPMLGHGPSSAPRPVDDDNWYKREEMPDSTTSQRLDRSTSPCVLMDAELTPLGSLPYTRKRAQSGEEVNSPASVGDPKHLCQNCGRFYSSEWNLERHRRESCPTKVTDPVSPSSQNDDVTIRMGSCQFVLPRTALTKASSAFTSLFLLHDPAKGDLRLEGDPMDFQNLLDVYNDPINLTRSNVDQVLRLAEQYKFAQVTDTCAKFIESELSKQSLMHAIRLAEQFKLLAVKQRLFSSISIEVFRALNSDRDYQMMSSELKAELLEKWGTFL